MKILRVAHAIRNVSRPCRICAFSSASSPASGELPQTDWSRSASWTRDRVASQKLDEMKKLVEDLTTGKHKRDARELNSALEFWLSHGSLNVCSKQGRPELPLMCAQTIIDWSIAQKDPNLLVSVLRDSAGSLNRRLTRLMHLYISNLQGTRTLAGRRRKVSESNRKDKLQSLMRASNLWNTIDRLHNDPKSPVKPCVESQVALLTLWSRRIKALSELRNLDFNDPSILEALGGKTSTQECLDEMMEIERSVRLQIPSGKRMSHFYSTILSGIAQSRVANSSELALQIIERLEKDPAIELSSWHYSPLLVSLCNDASPERPELATQALKMWEEAKTWDSDLSKAVAMTTVLNTFVNCGRLDDLQGLIDSMEARGLEKGRVRPTVVHYNACLTAWAKSRRPEAVERVEALLAKMTFLASHGKRPEIEPDRFSYTATISAILFNHPDVPDALDRAEAILRSCEAADAEAAMLDTTTYLTFLRGCLRLFQRDINPQPRERICLAMEGALRRMHTQSRHLSLVQKPIPETYALVLEGWLMSNSELAAPRAVALIDDMEAQKVSIDAKTIALALKCLCVKSLGGTSSMETRAIANNSHKLMAKLRSGGINKTEDVFNAYLRVLSVTGRTKEAEELVLEAQGRIQLDKAAYKALIEGYVNQGRLEDAERILNTFLNTTRDPSDPFPTHLTATLMGAWSRSNLPDAMGHAQALFDEACRHAKPDKYLYGAYLSALRLSGLPDAPQRIEGILAKMQQEYETGVNPSGQPSAAGFATVITAWAQSGQSGAAERAESILYHMIDLSTKSDQYLYLKPTLSCFRSAIVAWARSERDDAGKRALAILDLMEARTKSSFVFSDSSCYKNVMLALARMPQIEKAQNVSTLLSRMGRVAESGNRGVHVDADIYAMALRTIVAPQDTPLENRASSYPFARSILDAYLNSPRDDDGTVFLQYLWTTFTLLAPGDFRDAEVLNAMKSCPRELLISDVLDGGLRRVLSRPAFEDLLAQAQQKQY